MAGKREVERECRRLNQVRNVREVGTCSIRDYWNQAPGNYLIAGGTEHSRTAMLHAKLLRDMDSLSGPCFVLTTSDLLEQNLIRSVEGSETRRIFVSSQNYRNYHFFYGWSSEEIIQYFTRASALLGYTSQEMPIYIRAFIGILSRRYRPSMASLIALSKLTDQQIGEVGARSGASREDQELILQHAGAGKTFRLVLEQAHNVFSPITTIQCETGYNLSSISPAPGAVCLVNIRSNNPVLMNEYFAMELRRAALRGVRPRVVISDLQLRESDPLVTLLQEYQNAGFRLGISLENPSLLPLDNSEGSIRLQSRAILLDAGFADGDLERLLTPLGTYTHYEALTDGGRPPKLLALVTDEHWRATPEPGRPRVRPADVRGCRAVLYGGSGSEILLARALR